MSRVVRLAPLRQNLRISFETKKLFFFQGVFIRRINYWMKVIAQMMTMDIIPLMYKYFSVLSEKMLFLTDSSSYILSIRTQPESFGVTKMMRCEDLSMTLEWAWLCDTCRMLFTRNMCKEVYRILFSVGFNEQFSHVWRKYLLCLEEFFVIRTLSQKAWVLTVTIYDWLSKNHLPGPNFRKKSFFNW